MSASPLPASPVAPTDSRLCRRLAACEGLVLLHRDSSAKRRGAFTLLELAVVLGVVLLLVATLAPGFSKSSITSSAMQCLNNNRRLCVAWRMYADDSADQLTYASSIYPAPDTTSNWPDRYAWTGAHMDFNPYNRANWDPAFDLMRRPLWPYEKSQTIYKCPSDRSSLPTAAGVKPRVRTMSMNLYVGGFAPMVGVDELPRGTDGGWPFADPYRIYNKVADFGGAGGRPDQIFVFTDERDDLASWGSYLADMTGYSPINPEAWTFQYDMPGMYHDRAASFSFADGHGEIKRWTDPRTTPPYGTVGTNSTPSPNNPDVYWIQDHATRLR